MSIKKKMVEDKSIKLFNREIEFNYPGEVTIKAINKLEADKKYKAHLRFSK